MQRRKCIKLLSSAALLGQVGKVSAMPAPSGVVPGMRTSDIHIFSKVLHWLDYNGLAKTVKQIGFDGVDLTVRPGGHVLPEKVASQLPEAVDALRKVGLKVDMMTTAITSAQQQHTEAILKTASGLGIKYYRLGWLDYDIKQPIDKQVEKYKKVLKELEQMNQHFNISGGYQNHYGTSVGAAVWDIWLLIKDLNPKWLGCQYDIRHAVVEGMNSWKLGLNLLQSNIQSLGFKDFTYAKKETGWGVENTPIGNGVIDFKGYIKLLNEMGIAAPVTLHAEYDLGGAEKGERQITLPAEKIVAALKQDLDRLRQLFIEA